MASVTVKSAEAHSDVASQAGLSSAEAATRLAADGPKALGKTKRTDVAAQIAHLFANPLGGIPPNSRPGSGRPGEGNSAAIYVANVGNRAGPNFLQTVPRPGAGGPVWAQGPPTATVR